jgi:hypothetical protein
MHVGCHEPGQGADSGRRAHKRGDRAGLWGGLKRIAAGQRPLELRPVNLTELLQSATNGLQSQCDAKDVRLPMAVSPELPLALKGWLHYLSARRAA